MDTFNQPKKTNGFLLFLLVVLVVAAGMIGYLFGGGGSPAIPVSNSRPVQTAVINTSPDAVSTTPAQTSEDKMLLTVAWQKPAQIPSLKLFVANPSDTYLNSEKSVTYYKVGSIKSDEGPIDVLYVHGDNRSFADASDFVFLSKSGTSVVLLSNYGFVQDEAGTVGSEGLIHAKFTIDKATKLSGTDFPDSITGTLPRQVLTHDNDVYYTWANVTSSDPVAFNDPTWGPVRINEQGAFYISTNPLQIAFYTFRPDFYDSDSMIPHITFADGRVNEGQYNYASVGGCGFTNYVQTVSNSIVNVSKDLIPAGKTNKGDTIYKLKDDNSQLLKDVYTSFPTDPPTSYPDFLAAHPLLFWVDPFGRTVMLQNTHFASQAECGKPVIYLYPTHTMPVSVKLYPQGGFTYSDPPYNAGWDVVAEPNGTLHIGFASSSYPFLFWEGRGGIYEQPKQGWVVAKKNVPSFLKTKLAQLGLNSTETRDFMDFWVPRMQAKPYYFVTFMGNQTMDTLAPLVIDPKPDTIIRVLMDFTPLDKPISVKSYPIKKPMRKGFTVIEWGGVLR